MVNKQKIVQSSAEGKLRVESEIFEDDNWEFSLRLFSTSNTEDWYVMKLAYAEYSMQRGDERGAFDIYTSILEEVVANGKIKHRFRNIAFDAYNGLLKVIGEGSEYIWESGVSIIEGYRNLFEVKK